MLPSLNVAVYVLVVILAVYVAPLLTTSDTLLSQPLKVYPAFAVICGITIVSPYLMLLYIVFPDTVALFVFISNSISCTVLLYRYTISSEPSANMFAVSVEGDTNPVYCSTIGVTDSPVIPVNVSVLSVTYKSLAIFCFLCTTVYSTLERVSHIAYKITTALFVAVWFLISCLSS